MTVSDWSMELPNVASLGGERQCIALNFAETSLLGKTVLSTPEGNKSSSSEGL